MKVAIVCHYNQGGSLFYLQQLTTALEQKGFKGFFYLPRNTLLHILQDDERCRRILLEPSVDPAIYGPKFLKYLMHLMKYLSNSFFIDFPREVEVVHLLFPFYLTDWITVSRLKKKRMKVVLTVHELLPHKAFLGGTIDMKLNRLLYQDADLLLVHTDSLKQEIISLFQVNSGKVKVIPHGWFNPSSMSIVKSCRAGCEVPRDKRTLLFFGSIRDNKGLDLLLKAMQLLDDQFFLLIAGAVAGAHEVQAGYYREMIKQNDLERKVLWIERYIAPEEIEGFFGLADAVILPYRSSFHAQSGVLNLSVGYEKPCIVSDVGGMGEVVRQYALGIVVPPDNPYPLAEGIIRLFKSNLSYGFSRYKEDNNWDKYAEKLIEIYSGFQPIAG
jgi:glycosyltransferase involved in cell wall biosynthesis